MTTQVIIKTPIINHGKVSVRTEYLIDGKWSTHDAIKVLSEDQEFDGYVYATKRFIVEEAK